MWRSIFLAIGCYFCFVGLQCLVIDKAVIAGASESRPGIIGRLQGPRAMSKEIVPPEWAPWSFLSAGAVTILYTCTLPRRIKEKT